MHTQCCIITLPVKYLTELLVEQWQGDFQFSWGLRDTLHYTRIQHIAYWIFAWNSYR